MLQHRIKRSVVHENYGLWEESVRLSDSFRKHSPERPARQKKLEEVVSWVTDVCRDVLSLFSGS